MVYLRCMLHASVVGYYKTKQMLTLCICGFFFVWFALQCDLWDSHNPGKLHYVSEHWRYNRFSYRVSLSRFNVDVYNIRYKLSVWIENIFYFLWCCVRQVLCTYCCSENRWGHVSWFSWIYPSQNTTFSAQSSVCGSRFNGCLKNHMRDRLFNGNFYRIS